MKTNKEYLEEILKEWGMNEMQKNYVEYRLEHNQY